MSSKQLGVGLIGLGTVGSGVYTIIQEKASLIEQKSGLRLNLRKVADLDPSRASRLKVPRELFTINTSEVLEDEGVEVVVELIGGKSPAREIIHEAIERGKAVVTANKWLLAEEGPELLDFARSKGVELRFEASVGGGIPIIKALREGLVANDILLILGIINGTTNYILTKMSEEGTSFQEALAQAQQRGFAEADPTMDVEGYDSAHKLAILSSLAFSTFVKPEDISIEGISSIDAQDISYTREMGYGIKLLAIAKAVEGALEVRVHPTLLPVSHLLTSVKNEFNAIYIKGAQVGTTMFYGKGAGSLPAGSAVVSDLVDIGLNRHGHHKGFSDPSLPKGQGLPIRSIHEITCSYYLRFNVLDSPGILGKIATILGSHSISIASLIQRPIEGSSSVPIVMLTHEAKEESIQRALAEIDRLPFVLEKSRLLRVEEGKEEEA